MNYIEESIVLSLFYDHIDLWYAYVVGVGFEFEIYPTDILSDYQVEL